MPDYRVLKRYDTIEQAIDLFIKETGHIWRPERYKAEMIPKITEALDSFNFDINEHMIETRRWTKNELEDLTNVVAKTCKMKPLKGGVDYGLIGFDMKDDIALRMLARVTDPTAVTVFIGVTGFGRLEALDEVLQPFAGNMVFQK